jgi:hypothetical protein
MGSRHHYPKQPLNRVNFRSVVRDTRIGLHLSFRDIEYLTDGMISRKMLAQIENGDLYPHVLQPLFIKQLAMTLGVNFAYLLTVAGYLSIDQLREWNSWKGSYEQQHQTLPGRLS